MADSEIAGLTEDTTPDLTDNVYVQDAAGAVDKRVPLSAMPVSTAQAAADRMEPVAVASNRALQLSDAGKMLILADAVTDIEIPANATVAFPLGTRIGLVEQGTNPTLNNKWAISSAVGVVCWTPFPDYQVRRNVAVWLVKTGTDTWQMHRDGVPGDVWDDIDFRAAVGTDGDLFVALEAAGLEGVCMPSPNGHLHRITVDNDGRLQTEDLSD